MAAAAALREAIAGLDVRFGARTVTTATSGEDRSRARRYLTGTPFDAVSGGIAPGGAIALVGEGTCGKVTLALRAVAGAQRDGATAMWVDCARSFDPLAAARAAVDLGRLIVVRPRDTASALVAATEALRSTGFRLVVVDTGPSFAQAVAVDGLSRLVPHARGSTSALVVVSDAMPRALSIPAFVFERSAWKRAQGRTTGWTCAVRRAGDASGARGVLAEAV